MNSKTSFLIAIGFLILAHFQVNGISDSTLSKQRPATQWEQVEETDDITFYERLVSLSDTRQTRERKGVFYIGGHESSIAENICAAENIQKWMVGAMEVTIVENENPENWTSMILYDAPWPYKNRELVAKYQIESIPKSEKTYVWINADTSHHIYTEGTVRLENYEALWVVTKQSDNRYKIEFSTMSDTPPMAPLWIQDPITRKIFKKNLENFIGLSAKASKESKADLVENMME